MTLTLKESSTLVNAKFLSVVIPVFNEELVIEETINRVKNVLEKAKLNHEIIIVNDGSTDRTLEICLAIQKISKIRIINLGVNSGHMAAITAGLEASQRKKRGGFVATMDADLQDPPEALAEMHKVISANSSKKNGLRIDVVQAYRIDRSSDSIYKRLTAGFYYRTIEKLTGIHLIHHAADFRVMSYEVVDTLLRLPERNRIYRLLIPKLGFCIYPYPIIRAKRFAGETKYSRKKMIRLSLDSIFAFSNIPLRFFSYLGFTLASFFLAASIVTFLVSLITTTVPGWPSLALLLLSMNSFLFAGFGLMGEYIGRIYELVQARPIANWYELK
jgi:glycosyltransferase involved in cell wall biosynthesis